MTENTPRLIVGLGNPGENYRQTRHNVGFLVVERLATEFGVALNKSKFNAVYGTGMIEKHKVILMKPMVYMNRSGMPVVQLAGYFKIPERDMLVIHDDIDLAFGRLKIKEKGGHGGHKGLKSIMEAFGQDRFVRVRIGVGRSTTGRNVANHVLGRFSGAEASMLGRIIETARDAVVSVLCEGAGSSMNRFNSNKTMISS